jgi:hypothetical protein
MRVAGRLLLTLIFMGLGLGVRICLKIAGWGKLRIVGKCGEAVGGAWTAKLYIAVHGLSTRSREARCPHGAARQEGFEVPVAESDGIREVPAFGNPYPSLVQTLRVTGT